MDLRSGNVYWPDLLCNPPSYSCVEKNLECDVLIVGAGVSGACCAYELKNTGLNVILIEKERVAAGSTSANTGLLQFSSDQLLHQAIQAFGEKAAVEHYKRCCKTIVRLNNQIIPQLPINPDLVMRKSLFFASSEKDQKTIQLEYEALKKAKFNVQYADKREMTEWVPFTRPAALITTGDAEINPYKLTHGLISAAAHAGVKVFEQTEVTVKKASNKSVEFLTKSGYIIKAKKVIFAQGYEAQETKKEKDVVINRTYAIVTNPILDLSFWKEKIMIWETARPYFYARTTADKRIIIGGLDEQVMYLKKTDRKLEAKQVQLIKELEKWFPPLQNHIHAEYKWSGLFANTPDSLPVIGRYEQFPNSYFLLAYGGNGTVTSLLLSKLITRHIMGKKDDAFSFYLRARLYKN